MTREECTRFNQAVDVAAVKAYRDAVGDAAFALAVTSGASGENDSIKRRGS
jgi:hypothetical protein